MTEGGIYCDRINRVIDYIEARLASPLDLEELAHVACFSKFHFHRIFSAFTGETLYGFITRIRLERAAAKLVTQEKTITAVALECGFNDSATFSRAFKRHFGVSATAWRRNRDSKNHQADPGQNRYLNRGAEKRPEPISIREVEQEAFTLAYLRRTGPYAGDHALFAGLHRELELWARENRLQGPEVAESYIFYHDPPGITPGEKLRISFGISVPAATAVAGEIGKRRVPGGRHLLCRFRLAGNEYAAAWNAVYGQILPQSGREPGDGSSFERYRPDCYDPVDGKTELDIMVPINRP